MGLFKSDRRPAERDRLTPEERAGTDEEVRMALSRLKLGRLCKRACRRCGSMLTFSYSDKESWMKCVILETCENCFLAEDR